MIIVPATSAWYAWIDSAPAKTFHDVLGLSYVVDYIIRFPMRSHGEAHEDRNVLSLL